jgi:hypothetical protein
VFRSLIRSACRHQTWISRTSLTFSASIELDSDLLVHVLGQVKDVLLLAVRALRRIAATAASAAATIASTASVTSAASLAASKVASL